MDLAELRVAIIHAGLESTWRLVDLQARRHVAVLAVALASAVTATLAGLAAEVAPTAIAVVVGALLGLALLQIRALGRLARLLRESHREAVRRLQETEALIAVEGEDDVDGPQGKPR